MSISKDVVFAIAIAVVAATTAALVAAIGPIGLLFVCALPMAYGWVSMSSRRPVVALGCLVGVAVFSSHVFALAYRFGMSPTVLKYGLGVKDLLAYLAVLALWRRRRAPSSLFIGLFIYLGIVATFAIAGSSPAPIYAQLVQIRGALVVVAAMAAVTLLTVDERQQLGSVIVKLVVLASTYALIELVLPVSFLQNTVGVGNYWLNVKQQGLFLVGGLPGNFFTGGGTRRLTGTFGDPLSAGYVIGATVVYLVTAPRLKWRSLCLLSAALLLTFTRAGWIIAASGALVAGWRRYGHTRTLFVSGVSALSIGGCVILIPPLHDYVIAVLSGGDSSTLGHAQALSTSLTTHFSALGSGWGTAGASVAADRNVAGDASATESAFVTLASQVGIFGLGALLVGFGVILHALNIQVRDTKRAAYGLVLGLAASGALSEQLLTFNSAYVPFLLIGVVGASATGATRGTPISPTKNALAPSGKLQTYAPAAS